MFMATKGLPRGIRKFIRKEKARIRREISDLEEIEKALKDLYERFQK